MTGITKIGLYRGSEFLRGFFSEKIFGCPVNINQEMDTEPLYIFWEHGKELNNVKELAILDNESNPTHLSSKGGQWVKVETNINEGIEETPKYIWYRVGGKGPDITDLIVFTTKKEYKKRFYKNYSILGALRKREHFFYLGYRATEYM